MAIPGGPEQWAFIMGKIRVDRDGRKIKLDYAVRLVLEDIIDDLQTDEKEKKLGGFGMTPPDHPEDLIEWIRQALTSRELSTLLFKYFLRKCREEFGVY